jgi:hypothetical protein
LLTKKLAYAMPKQLSRPSNSISSENRAKCSNQSFYDVWGFRKNILGIQDERCKEKSPLQPNVDS